jgi:hypothetical protein
MNPNPKILKKDLPVIHIDEYKGPIPSAQIDSLSKHFDDCRIKKIHNHDKQNAELFGNDQKIY